MTARLSQLLHDEAHRLDIPPAPVDAIITRGRSGRRRRFVALGGIAASIAAVGGLSVATSTGDAGLQLATDPAAQTPLDPSGWAVAVGSTVHLGSGARADLPTKVKALYYTSAGVVVRTGATEYTDAPDSAYALVTDDGEVESLGLELGDRAPSTDPTLPYLAYAEDAGIGDDDWRVVLLDVRTAAAVATVPVSGDFTWGGWNAPPVQLDGDHLYVGLDDATLDVAWRTGEVAVADALPSSRYPFVTAGLEVVEDHHGTPTEIIDAADGSVVFDLPGSLSSEDAATGPAAVSISPDGRHALLVPWGTCGDDGSCVYDVPDSTVLDIASGSTTTVQVGDQMGWTPDGRLLRVDAGRIDLCSAESGSCEPTGVTIGEGSVKVGGNSYES